MYLTIRAFYRYSRHPVTKPLRWQAARAQAVHDILKGLLYLEIVPKVILWLVLKPFAWVHEKLDNHELFPGDWIYRTFKPWYDAEVRRLNPIYLKAAQPELFVKDEPGKPCRPIPVK